MQAYVCRSGLGRSATSRAPNRTSMLVRGHRQLPSVPTAPVPPRRPATHSKHIQPKTPQCPADSSTPAVRTESTQEDAQHERVQRVQQEFEEWMQLKEQKRRQKYQELLELRIQSQQFKWQDLGPMPAELVANMRNSAGTVHTVQCCVQALQEALLARGKVLPPEELRRLQDPAQLLELFDLWLCELRLQLQNRAEELQAAKDAPVTDSEELLQKQALYDSVVEQLRLYVEEYRCNAYDIEKVRDDMADYERVAQHIREEYRDVREFPLNQVLKAFHLDGLQD